MDVFTVLILVAAPLTAISLFDGVVAMAVPQSLLLRAERLIE